VVDSVLAKNTADYGCYKLIKQFIYKSVDRKSIAMP